MICSHYPDTSCDACQDQTTSLDEQIQMWINATQEEYGSIAEQTVESLQGILKDIDQSGTVSDWDMDDFGLRHLRDESPQTQQEFISALIGEVCVIV